MLCCQLQKILKAQNLPVQSIRKTHKADTKPWGGGRGGRTCHSPPRHSPQTKTEKEPGISRQYLKTRTVVLSIHKEKSVLSKFGFGKQWQCNTPGTPYTHLCSFSFLYDTETRASKTVLLKKNNTKNGHSPRKRMWGSRNCRICKESCKDLLYDSVKGVKN